jgi:hypothetical protein
MDNFKPTTTERTEEMTSKLVKDKLALAHGVMENEKNNS